LVNLAKNNGRLNDFGSHAAFFYTGVMITQTNNSWIWATENGVNGLRLDTDEAVLRWYDSIGCACGDDTIRQTISQYRQKGVPGMIALPPADILAEIERMLAGK
jgi:hypothetical protein